MQRTTVTRAGLALGLAVAALAATSSHAEETAPVAPAAPTITNVTAAGSNITVRGTGTLTTLESTVVGTDAVGDGRAPGSDLVSAAIQPAGDKTVFTLGISNLVPAVGAAPAVQHHNWDFLVDNGGTTTALALKAIDRGAAIGALDGQSPDQGTFALQNCSADPQTGQNTCTSTYITGAYTDKGVRFDVPNALLGAASGAVISPDESGVHVSPGASDVIWFTNGAGGDTMATDAYTVPAGVVRFAVVPAGTDPATVELTNTADVVKSKSFAKTLPKPGTGSYLVVAETCHGTVCSPRTVKPVTL